MFHLSLAGLVRVVCLALNLLEHEGGLRLVPAQEEALELQVVWAETGLRALKVARVVLSQLVPDPNCQKRIH